MFLILVRGFVPDTNAVVAASECMRDVSNAGNAARIVSGAKRTGLNWGARRPLYLSGMQLALEEEQTTHTKIGRSGIKSSLIQADISIRIR